MIKLAEQQKRVRERITRELAIRLAPVIFELKPSVLFACHNDYEELYGFNWYQAFSTHRYYIERALCVQSFVLKSSDKCMQILFFRAHKLEETVEEKFNNRFLRKAGYRSQGVLEYLGELKKRFRKERFPHEIGIFLGYPLKDVVGFMYNKDRSTHPGHGSWKIYGKVEPSLAMMQKHRKAKVAVRKVIENNRFVRFRDTISRNFNKHNNNQKTFLDVAN